MPEYGLRVASNRCGECGDSLVLRGMSFFWRKIGRSWQINVIAIGVHEGGDVGAGALAVDVGCCRLWHLCHH